MTNTEKLNDYLVKIMDFARAITLDEKNIPSGSVVLTMADEIQNYGLKAMELLEK